MKESLAVSASGTPLRPQLTARSEIPDYAALSLDDLNSMLRDDCAQTSSREKRPRPDGVGSQISDPTDAAQPDPAPMAAPLNPTARTVDPVPGLPSLSTLPANEPEV